MATAHMVKLHRENRPTLSGSLRSLSLSLGFTLIRESSSDWSFVPSNEHHETPPKLYQSQLPMSKSCSTASPKPYISKKDVATQVTPKEMARLSKFDSPELFGAL